MRCNFYLSASFFYYMDENVLSRLDNLEKNILSAISDLKQDNNRACLNTKEMLNVDELCLYTGMAKQHIYNLTHKNKIPFYQPGGKVLYFKRTEIDTWLTSTNKDDGK